MTRTYHFLLLISPIISFAQAGKTTTIKLSIDDCRYKKAYAWFRSDTIALYKLPEDTLVYHIIPRQFGNRSIKIERVATGTYKLIYKNNFGQWVTEQVLLNNQKTNEIILCPDQLLAYPQNTLAKLKEKDTISIIYHSQGCFQTEAVKLAIMKEADKLTARLYSISWQYVKKGVMTVIEFKDGLLLKTVTMNDRNVQDFIRFENELKFVKGGGCTTADAYYVKSKYLNMESADGSCTWNGFYYLKTSLFGNKD